eukprot:CCRYP_004098-RA/>CCRYP_004098-RA protein AED:0.71 eAED:0.40 QI:0/0/0/0.5/0/0/2/0/384
MASAAATAAAPSLVPRPPGLIASPHKTDIVVPFRSTTDINICGVFHAYDTLTTNPPKHFWLEDVRLWSLACRRLRDKGYNIFQFTEYSSPERWFVDFPNMIITASLSTADFDLQGSNVTDPTNITANSTNPSNSDPPTNNNTQNPPDTELQRLQAKIAYLRQLHGTNTRPTQPTPPSTTTDTSILRILAHNQRQCCSHTTCHASRRTNDKPTIEFPQWDGQFSSKQDFLFRIATMKKDKFFATVTDWTQKLPGTEEQSTYLLSSILDKVPIQHRAIFSHDPTVADDGFKMLQRLLSHLQGNTIENQLMAITELASLEFKADDTSATYMARLRGLQSSLQGATIDQFLTLLALSRLDATLYPGTTALFRQGNTTLLVESLTQLES